MTKTAEMVIDDVYQLLKGDTSNVTDNTDEANEAIFRISGGVYKDECRPVDSKSEDIVVAFTTSTAGQIQDGIVTVNIYVPDIDPYNDGTLIKNGARIAELESAASEWVKTLNTKQDDYRFTLYNAIHSNNDTDIHQHFVVIQLRFRRLST